MRRGHRLHSVHGAEPDMAGLARLPSVHRCLMVRVVVVVLVLELFVVRVVVVVVVY